jgi:para-aminobenzoate synthetase/4-amino-4-deoxychorismate lyase
MSSIPLAIVDFDWSAPGGPTRERAGPRLVLRECVRTLRAFDAHEVPGLLDAVGAWARAGGYAVGFVAYEAAAAFDAAFPHRVTDGAPLAAFHLARAEQVERTEPPDDIAHEPLALQWTPSQDRDAHAAAVAEIRERIAAGDVYQVNHTLRLRAEWRGDTVALYETLRSGHRPPYAAFLRFGDHQVLSLSPELFLARSGRCLTTRPMKGTSRRGRYPAEDAAQRLALLESEKERAENLMIVDLLRSDLGRVARPGGVSVMRLLETERHSTVWQLTSTIEAESDEPLAIGAAFAALFPSGSITGAPKIAAMQQIHRLEHGPRGAYCGAVGVVFPGGDFVFNVAIRTLEVDDSRGTAVFGTGGGITWDSSPVAEYEDLLETMRLEDGRYPLLERHLARLTSSAEHLSRSADVDAVRRALAAHAAENASGVHRVRLTVAANGKPSLTSTRLTRESSDPAPWRVSLAAEPVDASDTFRFHKTTHRASHERASRHFPDADDVLLWNTDGYLTELTRANLVAELDGELVTPPVEHGLLAGVQRARLLDEGMIREMPLRREDIASFTRCWAVNAVRGMVPILIE